MRVLLIGATGLVGGLLAERLLAQGHEVHAFVRRPTGRSGDGWHEHVALMGEWPSLVRTADAAISCLGTTWAKAGSEEAFRAVDQDAVLAWARAARSAGVQRFSAVSSVGADAHTKSFYLRVKGETDAALASIGFDRLDIFRPGLLLGERGGDRRLGERIGIALNPLVSLVLRGRCARFAGIPADVVAAGIAASLQHSVTGTFVHENAAIRRLLA